MSTTYELRCLTCGADFDLGDRSNHRGETAKALLGMRPVLEALGHAIDGRRTILADLFGLGVGPILDVAGWLAGHTGHEVDVFSEYGERWGKCGERITCACGSHRHCEEPPGHDGEHR